VTNVMITRVMLWRQ